MVLYQRIDDVIVRVFDYGRKFMAMASDDRVGVVNVYGNTPEQAMELALWELCKIKDA